MKTNNKRVDQWDNGGARFCQDFLRTGFERSVQNEELIKRHLREFNMRLLQMI